MGQVTTSDEKNRAAAHPGPAEPAAPPQTGRLNWIIFVFLTAVFLVLAALVAAFLGGTYFLLHFTGVVSLILLPVVFAGGAIWCGIKGKWFSLGFAFVLLPPAWLITFLGAISEFPLNPSHRPGHAAVLASGAFASWLFLTLAFWPPRPVPAGNTKGNEVAEAGRNNTLGLIALVAGICGILFSYFFSLGFIPAILALICGIQARKQGQKYAAAGINLGIAGIAFNTLMAIMFIYF